VASRWPRVDVGGRLGSSNRVLDDRHARQPPGKWMYYYPSLSVNAITRSGDDDRRRWRCQFAISPRVYIVTPSGGTGSFPGRVLRADPLCGDRNRG
jgi:hypothetical protein